MQPKLRCLRPVPRPASRPDSTRCATFREISVREARSTAGNARQRQPDRVRFQRVVRGTRSRGSGSRPPHAPIRLAQGDANRACADRLICAGLGMNIAVARWASTSRPSEGKWSRLKSSRVLAWGKWAVRMRMVVPADSRSAFCRAGRRRGIPRGTSSRRGLARPARTRPGRSSVSSTLGPGRQSARRASPCRSVDSRRVV
jgi:hypothetical protein